MTVAQTKAVRRRLIRLYKPKGRKLADAKLNQPLIKGGKR